MGRFGVGGSRPITRAVEAFHEAVVEHALTHDGDPRLARHVYNARRRPNAAFALFTTAFCKRRSWLPSR